MKIRTDWMVDKQSPPVEFLPELLMPTPPLAPTKKPRLRFKAYFGRTLCNVLACGHCKEKPVVQFGLKWTDGNGFEEFCAQDAFCPASGCSQHFSMEGGSDHRIYQIHPRTLREVEFRKPEKQRKVLAIFKLLLGLEKKNVTAEYLIVLFKPPPIVDAVSEEDRNSELYHEYGFHQSR